MSTKKIGIGVLVCSMLLLILILTLKAQISSQRLEACEGICAGNEAGSCDINSCPFLQESPSSWIPDLAIIFSAVLAGMGIYLVVSQKEKAADKKEYDLSKLSGQEKDIFLFVRQKGSCYQSDIAREFNISKVKVTRILDRLSKKGMIERKRRGMTNLIELK